MGAQRGELVSGRQQGHSGLSGGLIGGFLPPVSVQPDKSAAVLQVLGADPRKER